MSANKFETMGKEELRTACREAGISYSKLNNQGMRDALVAHYAVETAEVELEDDPIPSFTSNGFADLLNPVAPKVTGKVKVHLLDDKKEHFATVTKAEHKAHRAEKDTVAPAPKTSHTGYKIEKDRPTQNGVKRPSATTLCGQIWAEVEKDLQIGFAKFQEIGEAKGWNKYTIGRQFYECRKFHGI